MAISLKQENKFNVPKKYSAACNGLVIDKLEWVETQLLDRALWSLFVSQFRFHPDKRREWRGEYWGKTMRGASMTYEYTKNEELYDVLAETVKDLLTTIEPSGRLSSYPEDRELYGWDVWCRKHTLLGLLHFLEICKDEDLSRQVLSAVCKIVDYIISKVGNAEGKVNINDTSHMLGGINSSSILEAIVRLYKITGEKKYLDFAKEIIDNGGTKEFNIFEAALEAKIYPYQYAVNKACEMMSCFEGVLDYYRVTGEEKYKTMAINFVDLVIESDITMIGCAGLQDEYFDNARLKQFDPMYTKNRGENCVTVEWMKLCYQLLLLTGDVKYADQIEHSMYNALFGAVNINGNKSNDGQLYPFDSYSPVYNNRRGVTVAGHKDIIQNRFWWGCCVAIGPAGTALPAKSIVLSSVDGLSVNLFVSGEYKTEVNGMPVTLNIETDYPKNGNVKITVLADGTFPIEVRIPTWSCETKLSVAGESVEAENGKYAVINRTWKNGDIIELELDMRTKIIRAESIDPNARPEAICHFALQRGPIVLARDSQLEEDIMEAADIIDNGGYAELDEAETSIQCEQCYNVKCKDGSTFPVIDYASAGQTWDKPITVWFKM